MIRESDLVNEETLSWRLAAEVSKQWFGHLVSPTWGNARINKALAYYLATMAAKQVSIY